MKHIACSLFSVPNCAGVKICIGASADKIAAFIHAHNLRSSNKNSKKSPESPKETETGSICFCVH